MKGCSNEGFFISIKSGETIQIREHASDALKDAERFGLTKADVEAFGPRPRNSGAWRRRVLARVLRNGWIRARGDGKGTVSLELALGLSPHNAAKAILHFLAEHRQDFVWVKVGGLAVSDPPDPRRLIEIDMSMKDILQLPDSDLVRRLSGEEV